MNCLDGQFKSNPQNISKHSSFFIFTAELIKGMKIYITTLLILILAIGYSPAQQNPPFLKETSDP